MKIQRTRPVLVWILLVLYTLVTIGPIFRVVAQASGRLDLLRFAGSALKPLGPLGYLVTTIVALLHAAFVVYLFKMRKQALYIFIASFAIVQVYGVFSMKSSLAAGRGYGAWAFSVLYGGLIIVYLWYLKRRPLLT